jgi:lysophospholipase L1-like esterase
MLGKRTAPYPRRLVLEQLEARTLLAAPSSAPLPLVTSAVALWPTPALPPWDAVRHESDLAATGGARTLSKFPLRWPAAEAEPVKPPLFRLGVAGDSLSDDYSEGAYSYAKNWVETLADYVEVGAQGTWGAPRDEGFEYNWAQAGATSATLLADGQHTGLAQQIAAGLIDYAVLAVGQNDFGPWTPAYLGVYSGLATESQIDAYIAQVVANIETALQTLHDTGGKVVLANVIDYGVAPVTRAFFPNPSQRDSVTEVLRRVNNELRGLSQQYDVPLVDTFQATKDLLGTNQQPAETVLIGGAVFTNDAGVEPQHLFVNDGIHPHTVAQAAIANLIVTAIQVGYGQDIGSLPFTEREMLELVGRGDEYVADSLNLNYERYVFVPGRWQNPNEACNVDGDDNVAADDVLWIINYLNEHVGDPSLPAAPAAPPPYYDVNADGYITAQDALTVIDHINNPPAGAGEAEGAATAWLSAEPVFAWDAVPPRPAIPVLGVLSEPVSPAAVDAIWTQWVAAPTGSIPSPSARVGTLASRLRDLISGTDFAAVVGVLPTF